MSHRHLTIREAGDLIQRRELGPVELTENILGRIDQIDGKVHSYVRVMREGALRAAAEAEAEVGAGRYRGPLHGIPVGLKDNIEVAGAPTTCNSRLRLKAMSTEDATVARKLREAGAIILGKHALYEFAFGGPAFDLPFPIARNPWNIDRMTGGSSSGSAAAVAAGLCLGALGTDAGGSIRQPAVLCGISGLKPTYGRVSRNGLVRGFPSVDHCGPMAWTSEDCALLLQAIAGYDPADPNSAPQPTADFVADLRKDLKGLRLGIVRSFYEVESPASPLVIDGLNAAYRVLENLGAEIDEAKLPSLDEFDAVSRVLNLAEIYAQHEHGLQEHWQDYARISRMRFILGAFLSSTDYVDSQRLRRILNDRVMEEMRHFDALVTVGFNDVAAEFTEDVLTTAFLSQPSQRMPFNLTGQPALTVCCGFSPDDLPIGMQIVGRPFDEATVLRIGHAYESATPWRARRPAIEEAAAPVPA